MPTLVVLQFNSSEEAEALQNYTKGLVGTVIGEYYLPSERVYCRCDTKTRVRGDNWRRHPRLGLWVCKVCKRPSRAWRQGLQARLTEALGYNQRGR